MADTKLSALTAATSVANADLLYIAQSGSSLKATRALVLTAAAGESISLVGNSSSSISIASDGGLLLTPAAGKNTTIASGQVLLPNAIDNSTLTLTFSGHTTTGLFNNGDQLVFFSNGTGGMFSQPAGGFLVSSTFAFGWFADTWINSAPDLLLRRDAANTLAQRNGTNAQKARWYETFTDVSNGAWLEVSAVALGPYLLRTQKNGSGTLRGLQIQDVASSPLGFFGATPVVQQTKAGHNNWAAVSDVVSALVNLGLLDQV